ncbi:MAG: hypothetical protein ACO23V_11655 [Chitinophagaceae bacterium]
MKVHLIPSNDLNGDLFTQVLGLLQAVPGVNKFISSGLGTILIPEEMREVEEIPDKMTFEKKIFEYPEVIRSRRATRTWTFPHFRRAARWHDIFHEIQEFRDEYQIPPDQFVILLTPTANRNNWFALLDENRPYNGFIHTDEWEHYISCDPAIPIAFEVVALALQKHIFQKYSDIERLTHERAIGCISDLCIKKSDIILKMRTADICPKCMTIVQEHLSLPEIHHALAILESLRVKMLFAQNFKQNSPPSRMTIGKGGRIFLTDYENIEIRMPSMEKALYILFLRHPEGLYLSSLENHRKELIDIYSRVSTRGMQEDMDKRINDLLNALRDQLSIKISRIKKAFTDAIGSSLADQYIIQGANAEKKSIKLSRDIVQNNF